MVARLPSLLVGSLALVLSACGPKVAYDDEGGDDETTAAETTIGMPDPTTVSTTSASGPPSTTTSTSDPTVTATVTTTTATTGDPSPGYCTPQCETVVDCCQGQPDCPGPYPDNWSCEAGACVFGACSSDDDCAYIADDWVCVPLLWQPGCLPSCETQEDCEQVVPGWRCIGQAPSGRTYCLPTGDNCGGPYDACQGFGHCDPETGFCTCTDDSECTDPDYVCSAP